MIKDFKQIFARNYKPLNIIEVSSANLKHNYKYLSSIDNAIRIAPVLKSNAYGHGLTIVAKELDKLNPPFFCVDSLYEAYELLKINIHSPILIMGYVDPKSLVTKKLPFLFAVFDLQVLKNLNKYQPHAKIHVFIDTGMHREGITIDELPKFAKYIKEKTHLQIEGLMSHFAESENPKNKLTKKQVETFQKAIKILNTLDIKPKWMHLGNSSAILNAKFYKGKIGNVARTGIASYGVDSEGKDKNLKPALTLKSQIAEIKNLQKGEKVGYNFTYQAKKNTKIAIIPIGYYDGVNRKLSNKGSVLIDGKYCPFIGRISMNIATIDISSAPRAKVGQEVIIYSNKITDKNSIQACAKICDVIPYELLVYLASSTKRILV